jgi:hypothetical protein
LICLTLACVVGLGCGNGILISGNGVGDEQFVGGDSALRRWLGISELEPISADSIKSHFIEKYPMSTERETIMRDASGAGVASTVSNVFRSSAIVRMSDTFYDPSSPASNCVAPSAAFHIRIFWDADSRLSSVEVSNFGVCF